MRRVATSLVINASPERVWDLYADIAGSVQWVPFAEEILEMSGPSGPGQIYRERTRLGGITTVSEWRVIEWDPPRRQVQLSTDMKMTTHLAIEVEAVGAASRVRQEAVLSSRLLPPLSWLHETIVATISRRGLRQAVRAAKAHLEAQVSPLQT
jgi:hypothetical protein